MTTLTINIIVAVAVAVTISGGFILGYFHGVANRKEEYEKEDDEYVHRDAWLPPAPVTEPEVYASTVVGPVTMVDVPPWIVWSDMDEASDEDISSLVGVCIKEDLNPPLIFSPLDLH
jgi:hypothetical protein